MALLTPLGIAACLAAVYVVLPRLVFPRPTFARDPFDRLLIDIIRMSAIVIAGVYVLAPLRVFQVLGLILILALIRTYRWHRERPGSALDRRPRMDMARIARGMLNLSEAVSADGNLGVKRNVRRRAGAAFARLKPRSPDGATAIQLTMLLPLVAVLVGTVLIRVWYPLTHEATVPSDNYVHLAWLKNLQHGNVFVDGVYPRGLHAFLATAAKLTPASAESLIRFAGPLLNSFFVFVLYVFAMRATGNPGAALVSAAAVGLLGTLPEIGLPPNRQIGTLPQEFAVLFGMLAVVMALEYVIKPERPRLYLVGMAAFVVAMSHPLGGAVVAVGVGAVGLLAGMRTRRVASTLRLWGAGALGTVLGTVYLPIGVAIVGGLKRDAVALNPLGSTSEAIGTYRIPLDANPLALLAVAGAVVGLLAGLWKMRTSRARGAALAAASLFVLAVTAVEALGHGVLHPWYIKRWNQMTAPFLPLGLAFGLAPLLALGRRPLLRAGTSVALATVLVGAAVVMVPPRPAASAATTEYEASARALDEIVASHERYEFTVVGTPEWYVEVLDHGYHVHLIDVADRLTLRQAADPAFDIPIPSRWVYVLTEKVPFRYPLAGTAPGVVGERYQDPQARQELMLDVMQWMDTYDRFHDGVSVWYEDDRIRVYLVEREPNALLTDRAHYL